MDDESKAIWNNKWVKGTTPWVNPTVNKLLIKHFDVLLDGKAPNQCILVPFCGKSPDLKWLYEQGMYVVGIELSEIPCKQFFEEHKLSYKVENLSSDIKVFIHDSRLKIILGDLFTLSASMLSSSPIHFIWDCHALSALPYDMQERYLKKIRNLCSSTARSLTYSYDYDITKKSYPPSSMTDEVMNRLFAIEGYNYRLLEKVPYSEVFGTERFGIGEKVVVYLYQCK